MHLAYAKPRSVVSIPVARVRDKGTWMSVDDDDGKSLFVEDMPVSSFRVISTEYKFVVETREDVVLVVLLTP